MTRWIDPSPIKQATSLESLNLPPLISGTLIRRGITTPQAARAFLNPEISTTTSPYELQGMEAAVNRIISAIRKQEPICVWGDFDVDGQTSTALLVQTLRDIGAEVSWHIPIRAVSSHGVHLPELTELIDQGVRLILTCDTGISAHEAVDYAASRNVSFIITDHHDPEKSLPAAEAVVNPKLLPANHRLANLAGVGVAYKLAEALLDKEPTKTDPSIVNRLPPHQDLLDLVALGLVADVALLTAETRALVQRGLKVLQNTQRLGLQVLAEMAGISLQTANEDTIGFSIAPRLNALGRLSDANSAVEFLLTSDPLRARVLGAQFEGLNAQRRLLTSQVYEAAEAQLRQNPDLLAGPAIVLAHPNWPGGVVGIVASKLVETYHKPAILLTESGDAILRGSARSIVEIHITKAIAAQSEILLGFGGHPMAAGLSLKKENLPAFRKGVEGAIMHQIGHTALEEPSLEIDAWLGLQEIDPELAEAIEMLAPFGAGNPPLVFACHGLKLTSVKEIGKTREHSRLIVEDENGTRGDLLWWDGAGKDLPELETKIDVAFTMHSSSFRGEPQITLEFLAYRLLEEEAPTGKPKAVKIVDLRAGSKDTGSSSALVFAEGEHHRQVEGVNRISLHPAKELVLYTCPPGPSEMRMILEAVDPETIYLIGIAPKEEIEEAFITRLAGLVKFTIREKVGQTTIPKLAAAGANREVTVRLGLEWLAAGGHITFTEEGEVLSLSTGDGLGDKYLQKELRVAVKGSLQETEAYRRYISGVKNPADLFN